MSNQLTLELPLDITIQEARFLLAAKLYEVGRLSMGQAAVFIRIFQTYFHGAAG